jgi:hypothetical protein
VLSQVELAPGLDNADAKEPLVGVIDRDVVAWPEGQELLERSNSAASLPYFSRRIRSAISDIDLPVRSVSFSQPMAT